jgi:hypothetical protein
LNRVVLVEIVGKEKFGRLLANLHEIDDKCITKTLTVNRQMIDADHGYEYFGGKKR